MIRYLSPFIIPLGLFILPAVVDSMFLYGQTLAIDTLNGNSPSGQASVTGIKKVLTHYSRFAHQFYFACFGYDLSILVGLPSLKSQNTEIFSRLILVVSFGIIFHILAYIHAYYVHVQFERKLFAYPMTYLNGFYTIISFALICISRWYEMRITSE